jgi:hypothetical protein
MSDVKRGTSAAEWIAKSEGEWHTLPSGNEAKLRQIDVVDMLSEGGDVPDLLRDLSDATESESDGLVDQLQSYQKAKPLLDKIAKAAFVSPVVGDVADPANNQIGLMHVSSVDKLYVFRLVFGGAQALAQMFPEEQNGEVAAAQRSQDLRAAAQSALGADAG